MSVEEQIQPQGQAAMQSLSDVASKSWFEYPVRAYPQHTDYAGVVWHGTYIAWMEAARIECLRTLGIGYADLVTLGCELPVVDLSIRYHRFLRMGMMAVVRTRLLGFEGVRINWDYQIQSQDAQELYVTAKVTLVAVDREKGKILRQLPATVQDVLARLSAAGNRSR
ncbi:thioesterase superfamily protein [Leptolyngbya sp. 'hensonii']|uniref:acyl-CoA thioesterase n=1 Tax=Leptolyngbya sp. 'hensonii' TaxID=1922337 RepID=UPI00094FA459|nr:thioesterase family protein [Leptolyngbya sp. 'hensonii']OLP16603.1 thioesterase superfamily protein [Leptolyngbya sp. 'hensonii']